MWACECVLVCVCERVSVNLSSYYLRAIKWCTDTSWRVSHELSSCITFYWFNIWIIITNKLHGIIHTYVPSNCYFSHIFSINNIFILLFLPHLQYIPIPLFSISLFHCFLIRRERLLEFFVKASDVKRMEMKAYAFIEFDCFESADETVKQSVLVPYVLDGTVLTVGWAKSSDEISNGKNY